MTNAKGKKRDDVYIRTQTKHTEAEAGIPLPGKKEMRGGSSHHEAAILMAG